MSEQTSENPMVTIELVGMESYTTLRHSYRKGEPYAVTRTQWAALKNESHPNTGQPIFRECKGKGSAPIKLASESVEGSGITITHNTRDGTKNSGVDEHNGPGPNDLSNADLRRAGLLGEVDTGAIEVIEAEGPVSGPSGHEDLDLDEEEAVTLRGAEVDELDVDEEPADQEPAAEAPTAQTKRAAPKIMRPGPRNAALKDKLPAPKVGDDEVQV